MPNGNGAAGIVCRAKKYEWLSERELAAQLKGAWIPSAGDLAKVSVAETVANPVELRVVEGIERLGAEFKMHPLRERERLVERSIEIHSTGTDNRVLACIAEALVQITCPCRSGCGEYRRIKPLLLRLGVVHFAVDIQTVRVATA